MRHHPSLYTSLPLRFLCRVMHTPVQILIYMYTHTIQLYVIIFIYCLSSHTLLIATSALLPVTMATANPQPLMPGPVHAFQVGSLDSLFY